MREFKEPQFDYKNGLPLRVTEFHGDGSTSAHVRHISPEVLRLPDNEQVDAEWQAADKLAEQPQIEAGSNGRTLEFVMVNPQAGPELQLVHLQWHTAVRDPAVRGLLVALALTGKPHMVVSSAGMGDATPLRREVAKEIHQTGSFIPYQEDLVKAYDRVRADYEHVHVGGESEGGRRAIALAALWLHVESLLAIDPPGATKTSFGAAGMAVRFLSEGGNLKKYTEVAGNRRLIEGQKAQDDPRRLGRSVLQHRRNRNALNLLWREPGAMARAGLQADVEQALPNVQSTVAFAVPTFSRVTDVEEFTRMAKQLAESSTETQARIVAMEFPGTHAYGAANTPVATQLYAEGRDPLLRGA